MTPAHPVSPEEVMALADGELDPQGAARVRAHVDGCPECQAVAEGFAAISSHLADWTTVPPTPGKLPPGGRVVDRAASRFLRPLVGAIGAAAAILVLAIYENLPSSPTVLSGSPTVSYEEFVAEWRAQARVAITLPPSDAKVTVVMFVDWLCAACVRDWPGTLDVVKHYEHAHPGMVRLIVKDLPWNTACNPTAPQTIRGHEGSCDAAVAVRIADEMGRRDEFTEWLVANQRPPGGAALPPAVIRDHAAQTLEVDDFERRYREMLPAIIVDADAALAARVPGTPHWLVNGIHVSSLAVLDMALRYELSRPDAPGAAPASSR